MLRYLRQITVVVCRRSQVLQYRIFTLVAIPFYLFDEEGNNLKLKLTESRDPLSGVTGACLSLTMQSPWLLPASPHTSSAQR